MPRATVRTVTALAACGLALAGMSAPSLRARPQSKTPEASSPEMRGLAGVEPIDTHVHAYVTDPALAHLLERLHLRVLNICVLDDRDPFAKSMEPQWSSVLAFRRTTSGRAAVCTTISPYDFDEPTFSARVSARLDKDFAAGAVAVKLYKTVGMEIKTKAGAYLMPDDPVFSPILENIAAHNRTLVAHVAEPDSCWQAPDPASPDYSYYRQHPEEYAYVHPEWPSKQAILAARDRMVQAHPGLRVVGAHLGSMEVDVNQIADRFDRYPNFAVDTAARVVYLMRQPAEKVRGFLVKYQDRVLYATDLVMMPTDASEATVREWANTYERDWKYFATDQVVQYGGGSTRGLKLPSAVLQKLYHDNAIRWIPGIDPRTSR
jgi:predicted TIM-barrel fold metal-dependent hydrolase